MFSTGQTVVVGVGLVMAAALGFTTAKALQQEPGPAARPSAPSGSASPASATTAARPATSAPRSSSAPAGTGADCHVEVDLQERWQDGFKVEITVTNRGDAPVEDWTASFRMPAGAELAGTWNADLDQDGTEVTVAAPDWGRDLAPGKSATFGFTADGTPEPLPGDVRLGDAVCS